MPSIIGFVIKKGRNRRGGREGRRVQTQLSRDEGRQWGENYRINDTLIPYHMHFTLIFSRTDDEDVRGLHPLLRLMPHHIELAGVQALVNLFPLPVIPRSDHFGFVHATA